MDGLPAAFPALLLADEVQKRAARVGFDWEDASQVLEKVEEEIEELREAISRRGEPTIEEELGDLFFSVVNVARKLGVDSEMAMAAATRKFARRFRALEAQIVADGRKLEQTSAQDMNALWERNKQGCDRRTDLEFSFAVLNPGGARRNQDLCARSRISGRSGSSPGKLPWLRRLLPRRFLSADAGRYRIPWKASWCCFARVDLATRSRLSAGSASAESGCWFPGRNRVCHRSPALSSGPRCESLSRRLRGGRWLSFQHD